MSSKKMYGILALTVIILSARLLYVAYTNSLWLEFWVSEFVIVVTAVSLAFLLKSDAPVPSSEQTEGQ